MNATSDKTTKQPLIAQATSWEMREAIRHKLVTMKAYRTAGDSFRDESGSVPPEHRAQWEVALTDAALEDIKADERLEAVLAKADGRVTL